MKKVAVFIGTRPEAIKLAPVVRQLEKHPDLEPFVVSTGQHREMLQQVVDLFRIPLHRQLDVMQPDQGLAALTARLLTACDEVLEREKPDFVLVQGDTTTVLSTALCAFYRHVPFGHVEAGLRTGNYRAPFPEEGNRVLAGRLATLHFAPTTTSRQNLLSEGVSPATIFVTGNTVIDALQLEVARQTDASERRAIENVLGVEGVVLGPEDARPMVLITGHRRENFGEGFVAICSAIAELAQRFSDHRFVYPVHLNPNVKGPVGEMLGNLSNVQLIAPQPYSQFVALLHHCKLVLTDSGGVQEEAPGLGKPVLVMRDTTERPEGVDAGTVRLVGSNTKRIVDAASDLLTNPASYNEMANAVNPYGDGHAAERIVEAVHLHLAP